MDKKPVLSLKKLNYSDVLMYKQSLKRKVKMESDPRDPLADPLSEAGETRHRVKPRPLGEDFKNQLTARVDRIESLINLFLIEEQKVEVQEEVEVFEDANDIPDDNEDFHEISNTSEDYNQEAEDLKELAIEKEKERARQATIKRFAAQKKLSDQSKLDLFPPELQEIAKQFPLQSVDSLIQINDEIFQNDELRNKLISYLTFIKEKLPKVFNRGANAIIEISVGRFLNWTGLGDKINLSSLPLFSEILHSTWYPSLTLAEYQQLITSDLKKKAKMNFAHHGSSKKALGI